MTPSQRNGPFGISNNVLLPYQEKIFLTNFSTDEYGLDCGLELNAKVLQLRRLNNVSGVLVLEGYEYSTNSEECERLKSLFSSQDYPQHLINSAINTFINSRVDDQQPLQASGRLAGNDVTRVVIPFKDQDSANIVKTQLKDLSIKLQTRIQPVFVSRKIGQDLKECETKPQLVINSA